MRKLSRRQLLAGAAATAAVPLIGKRAFAAEPLKVGYVYVGPVGDHGWTYAHDLGRKLVDSTYGDLVKTSFVENVSEGPDAERVIRQLAQTGNKLIFTTSFGYMNPTIKAAKRFPKVMFEHSTGYQRAKNVATYNARFYEGRAVIGTIAAHMSKSGTAGYIASFPIPEVVMGINAFTLAARKVNPEFQTRVLWVSTWYDPAKEADAAKALIDQGSDVIAQHTDSPAALQACEQRGLYAFGQAADMTAFAPKAHLTAIANNWGPYYVARVRLALDGKWKSTDTWWGIKEDLVQITPYNSVMPERVRKAADEVKNGIAAGTLHPFTGPIKNQAGKERLAAGATMSDGDLLSMDWYVQGVQT